jgi:hypothetical protein
MDHQRQGWCCLGGALLFIATYWFVYLFWSVSVNILLGPAIACIICAYYHLAENPIIKNLREEHDRERKRERRGDGDG